MIELMSQSMNINIQNLKKAKNHLKKAKETAKKAVKEDDVVVSKKVTDEEVKKENKLLIFLGTIFTIIVLAVTAIIVLLPKLTSVEDVKVPEVSGLTIVKAEEKLMNAGLTIKTELKYTASESIEEGLVVKTDPSQGRTVKEGTEVTLYISSGSNAIILENYIGKNYIAIKAVLETYKMNVIIEEEEVDNPQEYSASEIIAQEPAPGTSLPEGSTVTLYIPDIEEVYPDFTTGDYTLIEIREFAREYGLNLKEVYEKTNEYAPGTIIKQSRAAGTTIATGAIFTITIAEEEIIEDPIIPDENESTESGEEE